MSEEKKNRDVALKKYELDIKRLTRFVTQKNTAVIEKTIEKVEKAWTEYRDAEVEYLVGRSPQICTVRHSVTSNNHKLNPLC